jgi:hypothetical protein
MAAQIRSRTNVPLFSKHELERCSSPLKLEAGVKVLEMKGIKAAAFAADLGDPAQIRGMVEKARGALGPISVLEWTAYTNGAGDLLVAKPAAKYWELYTARRELRTTIK